MLSPSSERESPRLQEITCERVASEDRLPLPVDRSARLPQFIGSTVDNASRLGELSLAVIGTGSVGRRIALGAARMQPRSIFLVDPARIKDTSLLTHPVQPRDVGQRKALRTALDCKAISPRSRVSVFCGGVEELEEAALADASLVALASDNLSTEVAAGQMCLHLGVPLVHSSVHGESLLVQVRFFGNECAESACPACEFGPEEWRLLGEEAVFRCDGDAPDVAGGDSGRLRASTVRTQPTISTAFLCSLAASLALTQVTRHVLGLGKPVAGSNLMYCGYTHVPRLSSLRRRESCPCEHEVWSRVRLFQPVSCHTLRDVLVAAGFGEPPPESVRDVSFSLGRVRFYESARCCEQEHPVRRFGEPGQVIGRCPRCGGALIGDRFQGLRSARASEVPLETPLVELGAGSAEQVLIRSGRTRHFAWESSRKESPHAP
jgi:molybdopterin/thiamine biosynthesis adenylyltransferase